MRGVRGGDLLALARDRFGEEVSESDLDEAVVRIGGHQIELTSTRDVLANVLRRRRRWRRGYLIPTELFEGLQLPTRLRAPRSPPLH
jgi:hypothetical protein